MAPPDPIATKQRWRITRLLAGLLCLLTAALPATAATLDEARSAIRQRHFTEAALIYQQLAEAGDADAQYALAGLYRAGRGVKKDFSTALTWMKKAAHQGLDKAQYQLGNFYEYGWGTDSNLTTAQRWYSAAARQEHALAKKKLAQLTEAMRPSDNQFSTAEIAQFIGQAASGNLGRLKAELARGLPINATDQDGRSALLSAIINRHPMVINLLLKEGADANLADRLGNRPLQQAIQNNDTKLAARLIEAGASLEDTDSLGNTPLIIAAAKGQTKSVQLLLKRGANLTATNKKSQSAIEIAALRGHHKIVKNPPRRRRQPAGETARPCRDAQSGCAAPDHPSSRREPALCRLVYPQSRRLARQRGSGRQAPDSG
ncbi:ankyrin repeat domain-containing protein [endosymbiont of Tevnia jerichonana]|uniref:Ankyrin 2,3/unc44 n=1 Tax=endosymbiont of Tevnia jerichonana (vent Tica) TaxID=1049564 RepID=G2FGR0_9GAMM|nr:ankyrin repeat domain-containing protein [endosymbiont of Tevnia jerichonana]EGW54024.1 ankyrin 2,3/unc44 [endosymbiont of Tevnia jerichonana (vent Tica)]